jgi:hypothetical protein
MKSETRLTPNHRKKLPLRSGAAALCRTRIFRSVFSMNSVAKSLHPDIGRYRSVTLCTREKNKKNPENRDSSRLVKLWAPTLTPSPLPRRAHVELVNLLTASSFPSFSSVKSCVHSLAPGPCVFPCNVSSCVTFRLMLRLQIRRSPCDRATCKECNVVTVISGIQRMRMLTEALLSAPPIHPNGGGASETATEVQLTVANRNYLHQLASICTNLRNLHQKIFCPKNKSGRGLRPLQAPSTLMPFSQFSSSKVGRDVPVEPVVPEPNLNDLPSLRLARVASENTAGSRPITDLKNFLLKRVTPNRLRFAFDLTETNAIQRYLTPTNA